MTTISKLKLPMAAVLFLSATFLVSAQNAPLEQWSANHKAASEALGGWVRNHSDAAHLFFEWDGNHPERSQKFVSWTLNHPGMEVDAFVKRHPDWPELNDIVMNHKPAARSFMDWCRTYPDAARALMAHPGGLRWAGDHLFKADWNMSTPK